MKCLITYACGHTAEMDLYGSRRERERKIEWFGTFDCPACKLEADKKDAAEFGLPELEGTERQVAWALGLRNCDVRTFRKMEQEATERHPGPDPRAVKWILEQTKASYWIDRRDWFPEAMIKDALKEMERERKALDPVRIQAEAERLLVPENQTHKVVCNIKLGSDSVIMSSDYDPEAVKIVKSLGYRWNGSTWTRKLNSITTGKPEDRLVELGNKLIVAGFPVRVDPEYHERILAGEYEPEHRRWILFDTEKNNFTIRFEDGYGVENAARRITGANKYKFPVYAPLSSYDEVEEFADKYDFRFSPGAVQAIETYKASINVVNPVAGADAEYHEKDFGDVLNSSRDVLDDLKEED